MFVDCGLWLAIYCVVVLTGVFCFACANLLLFGFLFGYLLSADFLFMVVMIVMI